MPKPESLYDRFHPNPELPAIVQKLTQKQEVIDGSEVTTFIGGPLDFRSRGVLHSWLTPIKIQDIGHKDATYLHVIYLNCDPQLHEGATLIFNGASETAVKLRDEFDVDVQSLRYHLSSPTHEKKIIFRVSRMGNFHLPFMITPFSQPDENTLRKHIGVAQKFLEMEIPIKEKQIQAIATTPDIWSDDCGLCVVAKPTKHKTPLGDIFAYLLYNPSDPWQIYELYTHEELQKINKRIPLNLRIDSGCDIGQLYGDEGCDCHSQLLRMLTHVVEEHGIIIHAPTQDGRGYGLLTKMETEGYKRGIRVGLNGDNPSPVDTITAGKKLLGNQFDTRTYKGIAVFLRQFGFSTVRIHTDNKDKFQELKYSGITVTRIPTETKNDPHNSDECKAHIQAKQEDPLYFNDKSEKIV